MLHRALVRTTWMRFRTQSRGCRLRADLLEKNFASAGCWRGAIACVTLELFGERQPRHNDNNNDRRPRACVHPIGTRSHPMETFAACVHPISTRFVNTLKFALGGSGPPPRRPRRGPRGRPRPTWTGGPTPRRSRAHRTHTRCERLDRVRSGADRMHTHAASVSIE